MKIKGIKYVGPILDGSGYAQANRGNIMALYNAGVPITLHPISFEQARPDLGEDGRIINSLIRADIEYNVVIIHTTPEFWSKYIEPGKVNVGYTIWETSKIHDDWVKYINNSVDKVLVGCEWNKEVFLESGITIPMGVVPHVVNTDVFKDIEPYTIAGVDENAYTFYSIFQWCYDEKTRVLTKKGFKYFKDLTYDDYIATFNNNTEILEYQKPEKIVRFRRKDKMISLQGHFFDMCVTPDHKMLVRNKKESRWYLKPLNELFSKGRDGRVIISDKYRAKKNCKWIGEESKAFKLPEHDGNYPKREGFPDEIPMDLFLEFLGWYLSEGSSYKAERGYVNTITQVTNKKYITEVFNCISNMGYNPFIKKDKDVVFHSREMYNYLKQFGKANKKFIPEWVKRLSTRQIEILLDSLFKGDGSLYEDGRWVKYTTTSKKLAEDIQECLLKVGLSGAISESDPKLKKPGKINGREIRGSLTQYTVSVNRECNEPSMYYVKLEEIDFDGYVYCATVPNHTMLVERNGKVIFSGNTERKHPVSLIKSYWYAFQNKENVALVLKTYRSDYSEKEKDAIRLSIKRLKSMTPMDNYPPIYLISHMLSNDEIIGLHKKGDCYFSTDRAEGFGLSPFMAGACGKPIIVTGFGGSTEYAKPDNSYLIDYQLTPCSGMPWSPWYRGDQLWAEPDVYHASQLLQHVYNNREEAEEKGTKLQNYIRENFSYEVIGKRLISEIEGL